MSKYKIVDLFSGAGGFQIGFEREGFETILSTDFDEDLDKLGAFIKTLSNVERTEILPYHTLGRFKWDELGIKYRLDGISPPTKERIENAKHRLGIID